jgi:hypothetical protein
MSDGAPHAGYSPIVQAVALVFPNGRLPSARWRKSVWSAIGNLVAVATVIVVTPRTIADTPSHNPFGIDQLPREAVVASQAANFLAVLAISVLGFPIAGRPIAVAASTLAAFALSQPLGRPLQAALDRRFNRARYDAQRTADGFSAQLRNEIDLERLRGALRTVVGASPAPTSMAIWLQPSERTAGR